MADLVTTISESVTINGALRGSSNSVTISDVVDTFERVVTCINGNVTTIATFGAQPYSSAGAIDVDRCKYIRVTNLDAAGWIEVGIIPTATNYQVLLTPGFISAHAVIIGLAIDAVICMPVTSIFAIPTAVT